VKTGVVRAPPFDAQIAQQEQWPAVHFGGQVDRVAGRIDLGRGVGNDGATAHASGEQQDEGGGDGARVPEGLG